MKTKTIYNKILPIFSCFSLLLHSCGNEEITIPKPSCYLQTNLPKHEYSLIQQNCPYSFELAKMFKVKTVQYGEETTCHKDIELGALNGTLHFSYIEMEKPLAEYINFSIDKVDEHKIKATAIEDKLIIRAKDKVYGTFFELQGDVASPFQFYLTDSVKNFVNGVIYLNARPNYDSVKPSLDYLKEDLNHLLSTFKWR